MRLSVMNIDDEPAHHIAAPKISLTSVSKKIVSNKMPDGLDFCSFAMNDYLMFI